MIGFVVKVVQVGGLSQSEVEDAYCVLSTGSCKFTTKAVLSKRNGIACSAVWPESFLFSPKELEHAAQKVRTLSPPAPAAATNSNSSQDSSPILSVELWSSKRWGSDAVAASGELLLGPILQTLQPSGPALQAKIVLQRPNSGRSSARSARLINVSATGGSSLGTRGSFDAEAPSVTVELVALAAQEVPVKLIGPVGSGKAEVSPLYSCCANWLNPHRPVLHTSGGHLYQTPTIQLLKITLHGAQGLQNLQVDPGAAAAAAAAISRMTAAGEMPTSKADRAKLAAANAVLDGTKMGKNLIKKTSSWFNRNKHANLAAAVDATNAASRTRSGTSTSAASSSVDTAVGIAVSNPGVNAGLLPGGVDRQQSNVSSVSDVLSSSNAPAATAAAAATDTLGQTVQPVGGSTLDTPAAVMATGGSPDYYEKPVLRSSSSHQYAGAAISQMAVTTVMQGVAAAGGSAAVSTTAAVTVTGPMSMSAGLAAVDGANIDTSSVAGSSILGSSVPSSAGSILGSSPSLTDPVSRLKQAMQHQRTASVDTESVIAALEENGFHATDAPGGAFFYAKLMLAGDSRISRVVGLSANGEACWGEGFWLAVARPAPAETALEVELYASKDDKTRGKAVAHVKVPLHQLLQNGQDATSTSAANTAKAAVHTWLKATHVLQAAFSDHLYCTLSITVEAADWDTRAAAAGISRTLVQDIEASSAASTEDIVNAPSPMQQQQQQPRGVQRIASGRSAWGSQAADNSNSDGSTTGPQTVSPTSSEPPAATAAAARTSSDNDQPASSQANTAASVRAGMLNGTDSSSLLIGSPGRLPSGRQLLHQVREPPTGPDGPQAVAHLDVVVKAFDTPRALDVFFVLLMGPYCLVSSTSHSTNHHHWGWHLNAPVTEPAEMLTLALFAREDQAGGKKKVGASMLTMFSGSNKLVGKLRVRLSTLPANSPLNITMPLQGERQNLRAGHPAAAAAHLYFHLRVPKLLRSYLLSYVTFSACSSSLYLLASSSSSPESSLEALASEVQATTARWLEQQAPHLPCKVFRKVQDDGRFEFSLSRTRANWRRLTMLREASAPAAAAFNHLCSWENVWHSSACYCVILLFGMYPSKVLSVLLLLLAVAVARGAAQPSSTGDTSSTAASPGSAQHAANFAPPAAAMVGANGNSAALGSSGSSTTGSSGRSKRSGLLRLLPCRPPPVMSDPGVGAVSADEALPGTAVPTDPYTSLKQNYEGVVQFLTTVQNVLDGWAATGERLQLAFSWQDPLATAVLLLAMLLLTVGLWVLGLPVLVTTGLLWIFRHPVLRDPLPPPPANFIARMPTQSDTML